MYLLSTTNAANSIIEIVDFVSKYNGGEGAVIEFLDYILKDELEKISRDCEY